MVVINDYLLQLNGAQFVQLAGSSADLIITESGLNGQPGAAPTMSLAELSALKLQGKVVVAYVNTCVTDHNRNYWNDAWVTYADPSERDVGTVNAGAPTWLSGNLGTVDFDPAHAGPEAFLVDYRNPAWRALVIAQAVATVTAGYGGVFLDDVGRYFNAGYAANPSVFDTTMTDSMMALVGEIAAAIRVVDPNAFVVVNSDPFIGFNATGGQAGANFLAYDAAVDAVLGENHWASQVDPGQADALSQSVLAFTHAQTLSLENLQSGVDIGAYLAFCGANGILPHLANSAAYATFAAPPMMGLAGNDTLIGGAGAAILAGLAGNDVLIGQAAQDRLFGHSGNDTLSGGAGADTMEGGTGDDTYVVREAGDVVVETAGQGTFDRVLASVSYSLAAGVAVEWLSVATVAGTEVLDLTGNAAAQTITGNAGANVLRTGGGAADLLRGLGGNDIYVLTNSADRVIEGAGQGSYDRILTTVSYTLAAGLEVERLAALVPTGLAAINLTGNTMAQTLIGNAGANRLAGMGGNDTLIGGVGADVFVFNTTPGAGNIDRITDFGTQDQIALENAVFIGLATGPLALAQFAANLTGTATTGSQRILYDTDSGVLFFDADGNGAATRVAFAVLPPGLGVTAADFDVI
ncbi:MAG: hypothetical protein WCC57_01130 [Paracoccaceae bacterium]